MRSLLVLSLAVSAALLSACHSSGGYLGSDPGLVYGPGVVEFPDAERVYLPNYRRAAAVATIGVRAAGAQSARVNRHATACPAPESLPRAWSARDQACLRGREAACSGECGAFDCPTLTRPEELCRNAPVGPVIVAPPPPVQRQVFRAPPVKRGGNCAAPHRHNSSCHHGGGQQGPAFTRYPGPPLPPPAARPPVRVSPPVAPPPVAAPPEHVRPHPEGCQKGGAGD